MLSILPVEIRLGNYHKPVHVGRALLRRLINGYPYVLVIEPINQCNLRCTICAAPSHRITRKKMRMSYEDFVAIIDDVRNFTQKILLFFAGEPLLNPDIFKMINYAEKNGLTVEVNTNATLLNYDNIQALLDSNLSELVISFDGPTRESYEKFRIGANFDEVLENIGNLCREKKKQKKLKPRIELQCIVMRYNEDKLDGMRELAMELGVDKLSFRTLGLCEYIYSEEEVKKFAEEFLPEQGISRYRPRGDKPEFKEEITPPTCPYVSSSVILVDGTVSICCYDINGDYAMGNVFEKSFLDIWNSEKYRRYREDLMKYRKLPLCKSCQHPTIFKKVSRT